MKTRWTATDQNALDALIRRRAQWEEESSRPLQEVIDRHLLDEDAYAGLPRALLFNAMRNNADAIRDALAPFDSGMRCGMPNQEGED